jgi:hypothetical protein
MPKYYIVRPNDNVDALCSSMLDEAALHESITITVDKDHKIQAPAWEVSLQDLRRIHCSAVDNGFNLKDFEVARDRSLTQQTIRWTKLEECLSALKRRKSLEKKLKRIIPKKKVRRTFRHLTD